MGIEPRAVARVILPSLLPEAVGNAAIFEDATIVGVGDTPAANVSDYVATICAPFRDLARSLCDGPERHPDWRADRIDAFMDAWTEDLPARIEWLPLADGARVATEIGALDLVAAPGVCAHACALHDMQRGWLFTGHAMSLAVEPRVLRPTDYTESLSRISRFTPALILPGTGGVERSYFHFFRSTNLATTNLISNLPFALHGATPVAMVAYRDLGYWPRDLIRFTATVWRFKVMLDELVRSGVAAVDGEGAWAAYTMDRPPRG